MTYWPGGLWEPGVGHTFNASARNMINRAFPLFNADSFFSLLKQIPDQLILLKDRFEFLRFMDVLGDKMRANPNGNKTKIGTSREDIERNDSDSGGASSTKSLEDEKICYVEYLSQSQKVGGREQEQETFPAAIVQEDEGSTTLLEELLQEEGGQEQTRPNNGVDTSGNTLPFPLIEKLWLRQKRHLEEVGQQQEKRIQTESQKQKLNLSSSKQELRSGFQFIQNSRKLQCDTIVELVLLGRREDIFGPVVPEHGFMVQPEITAYALKSALPQLDAKLFIQNFYRIAREQFKFNEDKLLGLPGVGLSGAEAESQTSPTSVKSRSGTQDEERTIQKNKKRPYIALYLRRGEKTIRHPVRENVIFHNLRLEHNILYCKDFYAVCS